MPRLSQSHNAKKDYFFGKMKRLEEGRKTALVKGIVEDCWKRREVVVTGGKLKKKSGFDTSCRQEYAWLEIKLKRKGVVETSKGP